VCDLGNSGVWDRDYGWGVRVRRPFGARGMGSVRYGTRLGDLKNKQPTHTASLKTCKDELDKQTNNQIRENRRAMDRRARKAFEDEHKGPSKFAGKRAEHRTQEELRW